MTNLRQGHKSAVPGSQRWSPCPGGRRSSGSSDSIAAERRAPIPQRLRRRDRRCAVSVVVHGRVVEHLQRLRLGYVAERLDAVLAGATRREPTYLDFLDQVLRQEV